jgi:hypothetical protein
VRLQPLGHLSGEINWKEPIKAVYSATDLGASRGSFSLLNSMGEVVETAT